MTIHKPRYSRDFLQIGNDEWTTVNKLYSPYCLQLYLYLASNADNFEMALSPEAADQEAGIKRTTFHKYLRLLEEEGYLVWRQGNHFDFYTKPRPVEERSNPDEHFTPSNEIRF